MGTLHTYSFPDARNVVVCGDIHGEFNAMVFKMCIQYQMTDTLLIVAGDCGFGFDKPGYYENVFKRNASRLSKSNNWILMIRGNHDDPAYFNEGRKTMDSVFEHLKRSGHPVTHWYYGHFHQSWHSVIDGILFSMQDIMEFQEIPPKQV